MVALTKGRRTLQRPALGPVNHPVAANAILYTGGIGVLDGGFLKPGRTATGLVAIGVIAETVDNTGGANGAVRCELRRDGAWCFANHTPDPVTRLHIGGLAYIIDDQTVAATAGIVAGNPTRSAAGRIVDVDDAGVWIEFA